MDEHLTKSEFEGVVKLLGLKEGRARQLGLKMAMSPKEAADVIHKIKNDRKIVRADAIGAVDQCDAALLFIVGDGAS